MTTKQKTPRSTFRADARAPFTCAPTTAPRPLWDARPFFLACVLGLLSLVPAAYLVRMLGL